jgi:hypothetical protein
MSSNRLLIYTLLLFIIIGCQGLVYKKEITHGYYLIGVDTSNNISLCYELQSGSYIGVLDSGIERLGFNNKVIAVRSRNSWRVPEEKGKFTYYVIPLSENVDEHWVDTLTIGPMTKLEFKEILKDLDAGPIDFNIEI